MKLANRTALITGSSGGIGEEFARQLARRGVNLILVARREEKLGQLRTAVLERDPNVTVDVIAADLSVPGSAAELAATIETLGREVDILVNNAGVGGHGEFVNQDVGENSAQIQLNCVTLVELTGLFLPAMKQAGDGLIINVASTAALKGYAYTAAYSASKAAVVGWTRALAVEVARKGVTVNAVCPGFTDTDIASDAIANIQRSTARSEDEARTALARFSPLQRLLDPKEVADLVAYLASPAAAAINGQAIAIDGGETA